MPWIMLGILVALLAYSIYYTFKNKRKSGL